MTKTEHLLTIAAEECAEIAHRISKALRFGLNEVQAGQDKTNAERVMEEFYDFVAVIEWLTEEGHLPPMRVRNVEAAVEAKKAKIRRYFQISVEQGTLQE